MEQKSEEHDHKSWKYLDVCPQEKAIHIILHLIFCDYYFPDSLNCFWSLELQDNVDKQELKPASGNPHLLGSEEDITKSSVLILLTFNGKSLTDIIGIQSNLETVWTYSAHCGSLWRQSLCRQQSFTAVKNRTSIAYVAYRALLTIVPWLAPSEWG